MTNPKEKMLSDCCGFGYSTKRNPYCGHWEEVCDKCGKPCSVLETRPEIPAKEISERFGRAIEKLGEETPKEIWECGKCGEKVVANGEHICREDWEDWIDAGVNSFISTDDTGLEFLDDKDIANLKTHLSKSYRTQIKKSRIQARKEVIEEAIEIVKKLCTPPKTYYEFGYHGLVNRHLFRESLELLEEFNRRFTKALKSRLKEK